VTERLVASATGGIWRADGKIVKVLRSDRPAHPYWPAGLRLEEPMWWRREADAYESGLLPRGALKAARCEAVVERDDGSVALVLEDLRGLPATEWPLERYGPAARELGRWQGSFRTVPREPWLSRDWLRAYLGRRAEESAGEPLWADRELLLDALDRVPRTLCHLDLWPRNLFDDDGATVAIDWAFVGIGAVGEDAGNLVPDSVFDGFLAPERIDELHDLVWTEYLAGLRDSGWPGEEPDARLGFCVGAALKYVWVRPRVAAGRPLEGGPEATTACLALLDRLADEARGLASTS
jgi:Phosphotransferase enzyme family